MKKRKKKSDDHILKKFDQHVDCLMGKKPRWMPLSLFPDTPPTEVEERMASFFNNISQEYQPLRDVDIPTSYSRPLPHLTSDAVAERLLKAKKPISIVPGEHPHCTMCMYLFWLSLSLKSLTRLLYLKNGLNIGRRSMLQSYQKLQTLSIQVSVETSPAQISSQKFTNRLSSSGAMKKSPLNRTNMVVKKERPPLTSLLEVFSDATKALEDNRGGLVVSAINFAKAFN